jgi:hypothetical protein
MWHEHASGLCAARATLKSIIIFPLNLEAFQASDQTSLICGVDDMTTLVATSLYIPGLDSALEIKDL